MIPVLLFLKKRKKSTARKILSVTLVISVVMTSFSGVRASAGSSAEEENTVSDASNYAGYTEALSEIAKETLTPLDIYNYVRKKIRSEIGLKGSRSTDEILTDKKAAAAENALLLGELLKAKGYKVKYVCG